MLSTSIRYVIAYSLFYIALKVQLQIRAFDKDSGDVSELVEAFFSNDPYYPRPVTNDTLYNIFRQSYMTSCPRERRARGALFFEVIDARHAEKSTTL
jgi:hypothetical protein